MARLTDEQALFNVHAMRQRVWSPGTDDPGESVELASRIRAGDLAAETALIERYRHGLVMLLRRRLKDPALADDLCQEAFQVALQALRQGRLQAGEKLAAYLCGIARNLAGTARRRQHREQALPITDVIVDPAPRPDERLLTDERARLVRRVVKTLAARDQKVLSAFYLYDTPKDTICRRLGVSPAQFDLIKWRALKRALDAARRHEEGRDD